MLQRAMTIESEDASRQETQPEMTPGNAGVLFVIGSFLALAAACKSWRLKGWKPREPLFRGILFYLQVRAIHCNLETSSYKISL